MSIPSKEVLQSIRPENRIRSGGSGQSCSNCLATANVGERFKQCQACRHAFYCGKECQRQHWPTHKPDCLKRQGVKASLQDDHARLLDASHTWVDRHLVQLRKACSTALLPAKNDPPQGQPLWNTHFLRIDLEERPSGSGEFSIKSAAIQSLSELHLSFDSGEEGMKRSMAEDRAQLDFMERMQKTKLYLVYILIMVEGLRMPNLVPYAVTEERMDEAKGQDRVKEWREFLEFTTRPGTQLWIGPDNSVISTTPGQL